MEQEGVAAKWVRRGWRPCSRSRVLWCSLEGNRVFRLRIRLRMSPIRKLRMIIRYKQGCRS